jgi:thioester reductase-like protein
MTDAQRSDVAKRMDAIVHAGAVVNWLYPYGSLRAANVLGTVELLKLAVAGHEKPFHFVSTISTAQPDGDESSKLSYAHACAGGGYGLSKWVAEEIVRRAGDAGHPVAIYRPSMITGHSTRGIGNASDYVNRYLSACVQFGKFLDTPDERIDMTPVDFVANGIAALVEARPVGGATYHLTNIEQSMTYRDLGQHLIRAGVPCVPCGYPEFRGLALAEGSPLRALSSYFPDSGFVMRMGPWPSAQSRVALMELGVRCPPVDERLIEAYVRALRGGVE